MRKVAIPYPSKQRKLSAGRWSIWYGDFAPGGASISHFIHARKLAVDKQHFVTPRQGASLGQQGFTPTATLIASQIDRRKPFWPHQSTTGAESSSHLVFFSPFNRKQRQRNRRNIIIIRTISTSICCPSVPFSRSVMPSTWDSITPNHCAPVHQGELLDWDTTYTHCPLVTPAARF